MSKAVTATLDLTKQPKKQVSTQSHRLCINCFTLSALVFLISFTLHVLPGTSAARAVTPSNRVGQKLTSDYETVSDADWIRKRAPKHAHRRHQISRMLRRKARKLSQKDGPGGPHFGLGAGHVNDSDVIDTHDYDDVPGVWEDHLSQHQGGSRDDSLPLWQRLPTAKEIERFKKLVIQTMKCRKLPALTLTLVKGSHVLLTATLGHANPEQQVPVTRNTRFAIGSLTKAFTATLVSEVFMRRNISLDSPVDQLMPEGFELMDEERTRSVTVRDLLGHRTGVPGYFHALLMGFPAHVTRPQLLSRLRYIPAVVPLRSQFLYNNYLYTLAAHMVEKLTGRSWEALVKEVILQPLGMKSTGFVDEVGDFSQFALPCALLNGTVRNLAPELLFSVSPCGPAGSLYSSAHDMARWLQVLLSNGEGPDKKRVLQESALRETTRAVMPPPGIGTDLTKPEFPIGDVEQSYGMGWITSNYRGFRKVWHSGGIVTYSSRLWQLPGVGAALFVATNGPQIEDKGHALTAIASMAADLLLGEKFWLNSSTVCTFPAPWKQTAKPSTASTDAAVNSASDEARSEQSSSSTLHREQKRNPDNNPEQRQSLPSQTVDQYLGVYSHKAFGEIVIERAGNDVSRWQPQERVATKGGDSESRTIENGNSSVWLMLKFGRFGQLKMNRVAEDANDWEGRFVGPLWYVTASDESNHPVRVQFLQDESGHVDRIRYPIDGQYDVIEFQKRKQDVMTSSSYSSSCRGSTSEFVVLTLVGLYLLNFFVIRKFLFY